VSFGLVFLSGSRPADTQRGQRPAGRITRPNTWRQPTTGTRSVKETSCRAGGVHTCQPNQDLAIQRAALAAAGCAVVRAETKSGARRDGRTELQVLLDFVQPGDTLVVTRVDRLARSLRAR
jgi:resolvase-like protein